MSEEKQDEPDYPHWNRVYGVVIGYTIVLIILIWAFSRSFR